MKKLVLLFSIMMLSFSSYAQTDESTTYKVFRTEFYIFNERSEKWVLETKNEDVNIDMVSYKNVINIQAKTPTLYRIDKSSESNIGGGDKQYFGVRYDAFECVNMTKCTVDLVRLTNLDSKTFLLSVIFKDEVVGKINLRFFSTLD